MSQLFGRKWTRAELMERVGDISQLGGIRNVTLNDGNENGVRAVEVRTGTGFRFTVLLDRGMDISEAEYAARSLCWRSYTGDLAPAFFEPEGTGWLRGYFGGLLTTCGLTYLGPPGTDGDEMLGLHGRVSYVPGRSVCAEGEWEGDEYLMSVRGRVVEASAVAPRMVMTRRISTKLGVNALTVEDLIQNEGHTRSPFMMLYHFNFGFPLVTGETVLLSPTKSAVTVGREEVADPDLYRRFHDPVPDYRDSVFRHELIPDADGYVTVALINKGSGPFGAYIRYRVKELPHLFQWKMLAQGAYTVALEPTNCWVEQRSKVRERGELNFLEPGQSVRHHLEVGVLTSATEIERLEKSIASIRGRK